jgi:hypothetical protein
MSPSLPLHLKKEINLPIIAESRHLPLSSSNEDLKKILKELDDLTVGYLELMKDPFFYKIPGELRWKMVDMAVNVGCESAEKIVDKTENVDPCQIAAQLGLSIVLVSQENLICNLLIRSEYIHPKTIKIYEKSIEQLKLAIANMGLEELFPLENVFNIHVAHEIFHHLEKTRIGVLSEKHCIEVFRLGPIRFKIRILALSEIAAHTFAKALTGVKAPPNILDYIVKKDGLNELLDDLSKIKSKIV